VKKGGLGIIEEIQYDVLLSHNSQDKPTVEILARRLVEAGLTPWLLTWNLVPGEPWQEAIEGALDACQTVAVFLGPSGIGSWENEEMRSALEEHVWDKSRRVIPVLLPGAPDPREKPLPRFLRRMTWVDFRGGLDGEVAFQRLAAGIRGVALGANGASPALAAARPTPAFDRAAERAALERELSQRKGTLYKLREQAAIYAAGEAPLHLLNQIEAEEMEIRRIEEQLRALGDRD
jgi:hypothetical protein